MSISFPSNVQHGFSNGKFLSMNFLPSEAENFWHLDVYAYKKFIKNNQYYNLRSKIKRSSNSIQYIYMYLDNSSWGNNAVDVLFAYSAKIAAWLS